MNYLSVIERYHEYRSAIHELMASIIAGAFDKQVFIDEATLSKSITWLTKHYPFIELMFTLNEYGVQTSHNFSKKIPVSAQSGKGIDRSYRPYFTHARASDDIIVTEPYLSCSSHNLCISTALKYTNSDNQVIGILVIDIDLAHAIEFLMGDVKRKKCHPFFVSVYSFIVIGLFFIVGILLFLAAEEIISLLTFANAQDLTIKPFSIIIFLTLALAIFDLGKTTIEEEVLMQKDILRHSSTRRTITRFIATILIAVSIEALLLMFKSVLGESQYLTSAVAMMTTAIGLLLALGVYVYLGAKAEALLRKSNASTKP
ncbi:PDC sensor domain-containing protein [Litorilituus sediminis]|uniref:General glycosylation pathway protein n=1 Tax=Litorilituus sediminis TaxID=718192 RepID=A0A4P6P2R5_9GAMM|nr:PDC sensor domain-containing protein [Litorilituus sediminis]QBG35601.1 general glycosylation pathway protein [Litorilituus sediminis]